MMRTISTLVYDLFYALFMSVQIPFTFRSQPFSLLMIDIAEGDDDDDEDDDEDSDDGLRARCLDNYVSKSPFINRGR